MSVPDVIVGIVEPDAGTQIARTVFVRGSASVDTSGVGPNLPRRQSGTCFVTVSLGDTGAGGALFAEQNGSWEFTGTLPDNIPDGSTIRISADATGMYTDDPDGAEPLPANPGHFEIFVQVRSRPPEITLAPYVSEVVNPPLPYVVNLQGTTSGAQSGVVKVEFAVDGGPSGPATNLGPNGDWSMWSAQFSLPRFDDFTFTITATDSLGRSAPVSGSIQIHERFDADPDKVFGSTIYVRELCDFAQRSIVIGAAGPGPDRATLTARFRQPFDRLPDPAVDAIAKEPVVQSRIAVEVLRRFLATPAPGELDQRLRALAYESLLRALGSSGDELRQARAASQIERVALAGRLGFDLQTTRPDQLDRMTISPDVITDAQLEGIFGFRSLLRTDPFEPITALPELAASRQATLRSHWQAEDALERDAVAGGLPVIDPDHVTRANLAPQAATDPLLMLWTQRQTFIADLVTQIDQALRLGGGSPTTFDQQVTAQIGAFDLTGLATRDADGEDVRAELPARLDVAGLRFLARTRALLAGDGLINAEWDEVRDVLVGVRKRRETAHWREQEVTAGVVLQPQQFVVDPPPTDTGIPDPGPSRWRVGPSVHGDWLHTLVVRGAKAEALQQSQTSVLGTVEAEVLPAARDELLAVIGSRQNPVESGAAAATRLTKELCIDFLAESAQLITRADQAAETLLTALFALRSGRLALSTGGEAWTIADELDFDGVFAWLGSFQTWYAAITSFAYPENHLFPALYVANELSLHPTVVYRDFLADLRAERVTPDRATRVAVANRDRLTGLVGPELKDLIAGSAPVNDVHTNKNLDDLRTAVAQHYGVTPAQDQQLREAFYLVPVAVAEALQEGGHFTAALDWYQYAYAYQLPTDKRRIFPGLVTEASIVSSFDRPGNDWPVHGSNPHEVALHRANAYTRFTIMSITRCLLAFAETEFVRNTTAANARARALYEAALELIGSPDAAPLVGPGIPFPANPVWNALTAQASVGLDKIHRGLNITGAQVGTNDTDSTLPSQYRSGVLIDRAKNLVATAAQLETAFLNAVEQRDSAAYTELQAGRDLAVARAMIGEEDLKVSATGLGIDLANQQADKARFEAGHFSELISKGLNGNERDELFQKELSRDAAAASSILSTAFSAATGNPMGAVMGALGGISSFAAATADIDATQASFERREQEWKYQQNLAVKDVEAARVQVALATTQQQIASADRQIAGIQLAHAAATADFLATRFTNTELFDWMSRVLNQVYRYFLVQATAMAALAQAQLAFERQEPSRGLIQNDYWQGPPDPVTGAIDGTNRQGLTGSARLLQDITRLDQFAFETDKRKLHLVQTFALSELVGNEIQQFRETGVLTFATPQFLFDREFPGHYLRLVKRVKISVVALIPIVRGLRATLSASGISRAVVARGPFTTATLRRDPEAIAFTASINATGLFEGEPETGMLLPFEGMGVESVWQLELPKAANPFEFGSIQDVLLTLEYTALDSADYRRTVIRGLDNTFSGDRTFSLRQQFPDAWYDLNNPSTVEDPARRMRAVLPITPSDLPPHITQISVAQLTLFAVRDGGLTDELTISALRHTATGQTTQAAAVRTVGGIVGTRRGGGAPWQTFIGADPTGDWELQLEDTPLVRSWFANGLIRDLVLVFTLSGTTPAWT